MARIHQSPPPATEFRAREDYSHDKVYEWVDAKLHLFAKAMYFVSQETMTWEQAWKETVHQDEEGALRGPVENDGFFWG